MVSLEKDIKNWHNTIFLFSEQSKDLHTKPHRVNFIKVSHANSIKNNILQVVHNKILKAHDLKEET